MSNFLCIKLRNLKSRKNIKIIERNKIHIQTAIFKQITEVVFNDSRMCKWPETPLISYSEDPEDPEDPVDYTMHNFTIRQTIRYIKYKLINENNSYWTMKMSINYELLLSNSKSLINNYYEFYKESRQIMFEEIVKNIARRKLIRENNFFGDIRLGFVNFQINYDDIRDDCRDMALEMAAIVWHPSRMFKWPENDMIDEYVEDFPYERNTSTIRDIERSLKLRSNFISNDIYKIFIVQLKIRLLFLQTQE